MEPNQIETLTVRVPAHLKRRLAEIAAREHRTLSSQVAYWLERIIADYERSQCQ